MKRGIFTGSPANRLRYTGVMHGCGSIEIATDPHRARRNFAATAKPLWHETSESASIRFNSTGVEGRLFSRPRLQASVAVLGGNARGGPHPQPYQI